MNIAKSIGKMFDSRGPHNFIPHDLPEGRIILCTNCGWEKRKCKNLKNCSGNANGPYAKILGLSRPTANVIRVGVANVDPEPKSNTESTANALEVGVAITNPEPRSKTEAPQKGKGLVKPKAANAIKVGDANVEPEPKSNTESTANVIRVGDANVDTEPRSKTESPQKGEVQTRSEFENLSPEKILEQVDDVTLLDEDDDCGAVMEYLTTVAGHWQAISRSLHVKASKIDEFSNSFGHDPARCLGSAITDWLRWNYNHTEFGKPTWRKVAESVVTVNKKLFLKIALEHTVKGLEIVPDSAPVKQTGGGTSRKRARNCEQGSPSVPSTKTINVTD